MEKVAKNWQMVQNSQPLTPRRPSPRLNPYDNALDARLGPQRFDVLLVLFCVGVLKRRTRSCVGAV